MRPDPGSPRDAIGHWLETLGLAHYAPAFEANAIDFDVISELDHDSLFALGVSSVGDRLRILKAARQFAAAGFATEQGAAGSSTGPAARDAYRVGTRPERRPLTVAFCDIVESTALTRAIGAEAFQRVLRRYHAFVADHAAASGGHVAQFLGDGVLIYFGYPQAVEDAAHRAVSFALAARSGMGALEAPLYDEFQLSLRIRIGIHTGEVVVDAGDGNRFEALAVGEAPNVAARLQALAAPGEIIVGDATSRLVAGDFDLEPSPPTPHLTGTGLDRAFLVRGRVSRKPRVVADEESREGRLIGRGHENAALIEACLEAAEGRGRALAIVGEAGVGKTALVRELLRSPKLPRAGVRVLECARDHVETVLHPVRESLTRDLVGAGNRGATQPRDRLLEILVEAGIADGDARAEVLRFVLDDARPDNDASPAETHPAARRRLLLSALERVLLRAHTNEPLILVVEDAHWADATTLELLERIADSIRCKAVLLLATMRSGDAGAPNLRPDFERLPLGRLSASESRSLLGATLGGRDLPPDVAHAVLARADGIPLYIEALGQSSSESLLAGLPGTGSGTTVPFIPQSLHDALMSRIDRAGEFKALLQTASCLGRSFERNRLARAALLPDVVVDDALDRLCRLGVLEKAGQGASPRFAFRHELLRDAAYGSQITSDRRRMHERILESMLEAENAGAEALAYQAEQAGRPGLAIRYREAAGNAAMNRAAYPEAYQHFWTAARLLEDEAVDQAGKQAWVAMLVKQAMAASSAGLATPRERPQTLYGRAVRLIDSVADPALRAQVLNGACFVHVMQARPLAALKSADTMLEDPELARDPQVVALAQHRRGTALMFAGRFADAATVLEKPWQARGADGDKRSAERFGLDSATVSMANRAYVLFALGRCRTALECADQVDARSAAMGHPMSRANALHWITAVKAAAGLPDAHAWVEATNRFVIDNDLGLDVLSASLGAVDAYVKGEHPRAIVCNRRSIELRREAGVTLSLALDHAWLAHALAASGEIAESRRTAATARSLLEGSEEQWAASEIYCALGEANCRWLDNAQEGLRDLRRSIHIARRQGKWNMVLHAGYTLAKLLEECGSRVRAARLLSPVLEGFPEEGRFIPLYAEAARLLRACR